MTPHLQNFLILLALAFFCTYLGYRCGRKHKSEQPNNSGVDIFLRGYMCGKESRK